MRLLLALGMILTALAAHADETSQRIVPGMSMSLVGQLLDLNAPICSPAAGSYSVAYRNSIATGCSTRVSDDFATLVFSGASAATYTMPQSKVSTFTGSISGTTLTTPASAVVIGSVIAGVGVLDNTYVTAGSGTSWTVNNSQTVGSETLSQSVYPPGHGTCFKNNGLALLTLSATTSTIYGAAGVVNGNPAVTGGQVVLYPGGEACLQADTSNNYAVTGFLSGSWYQEAPPSTPVTSFQWTGLSGYPRLHLSCSSMAVATTPNAIVVQLAYGGTFQATGYSFTAWYNFGANTPMQIFSGINQIGWQISGNLIVDINHGAAFDANINLANGTGMGFSNDITSTARDFGGAGGTNEMLQLAGEAPLTTSQSVTGIQVTTVSGVGFYGMCWLTPRTGANP